MRSVGEIIDAVGVRAAGWLREGISPRRLAFTLVLGFAIGCIPLVGIPTALCAVIAMTFRLNQPAIQAANYAAMPFQVALVVPFVRLGGRLFPAAAHSGFSAMALLHPVDTLSLHGPQIMVRQLGGVAGQALLAWLILAAPMVLLMTPTLALLLRRVPALAPKTTEFQS